jgi:hypothetical protein
MTDGTLRGHELFVRGLEGEVERPRDLFGLARALGVLERRDFECLRANFETRGHFDNERLHINVLPSTLVRTNELVGLLENQAGAPVCFEVDEREIVGDPSARKPARNMLRSHGIAFAFDNVCPRSESGVGLQGLNVRALGATVRSRSQEFGSRAYATKRVSNFNEIAWSSPHCAPAQPNVDNALPGHPRRALLHFRSAS